MPNWITSKIIMNGYQILFFLLLCSVPPTIYVSYMRATTTSNCGNFDKIQPYSWRSHQIILFWTNFFEEPITPCSLENNKIFRRPWKCRAEFPNCIVTSNHNMRNHSQAFIFHHRDIIDEDIPNECSVDSSRPCILFNMEAPDNVNNLTDMIHYHLTANYQYDSDMHVPYGSVHKRKTPLSREAILSEVPMANRTKSAAWIVSNCKTKNKREDYVKELQKFIDVDIYGDCSDLKCSRDNHDECLNMISNQYYFYLSFENTFAKDYATEKVFYIQKFPIVPIVYGGANYSRLLAPNSYIDASSITPSELASKMKYLIDNEDKYKEYFDWRREYTVESNSVVDELLCKTCKLIRDVQNSEQKTIFKSKSGKDFNDWYQIPPSEPKPFDFRPLIICLLAISAVSFIYFYFRRKIYNLYTRKLFHNSLYV